MNMLVNERLFEYTRGNSFTMSVHSLTHVSLLVLVLGNRAFLIFLYFYYDCQFCHKYANIQGRQP